MYVLVDVTRMDDVGTEVSDVKIGTSPTTWTDSYGNDKQRDYFLLPDMCVRIGQSSLTVLVFGPG